MLYRAIGLMSGSSLDGLDISFAEIHENGGKWSYAILMPTATLLPEWREGLRRATELNARDYQLLHTDYGHYSRPRGQPVYQKATVYNTG